jgi:diguanylate cyclase (GGDEF)-like protein
MADLDAALQLAERVRSELAAAPLVTHPAPVGVTASFGVAQLAAGEDIGAWLARADQALYRAKANGRNGVVAG